MNVANTSPSPTPSPVQRLATLDKHGNLRADCPGWPGQQWAHEGRGRRWLDEFVDGDDVANVRAWLGDFWAAPVVFRVQINGRWHRLRAAKTPRPIGWVVAAEVVA